MIASSFSKYIIERLFPTYFENKFDMNASLNICQKMDLYQLAHSTNKFTTFKHKIKYTMWNYDYELEIFVANFCYIQKIHNAFCTLARSYLFKKAMNHNEYNLLLEEIPEQYPENKFYITLMEQNTKYTFRIGELTTIIYNSLTYHEEYFIECQLIKNPYTNMSFSKYNLYNIYFKLIEKHITPHELFSAFFRSNFVITQFIIDYQSIIKDFIIVNETKSMSAAQAIYHIENMLNDFVNIIFDEDFDLTKLHYFDKYLYKYLYTLYGLNNVKKRMMRKSLQTQLRLFKKANVNYGRKIYNIQKPFGNRSYIVDTIYPYEESFDYRI